MPYNTAEVGSDPAFASKQPDHFEENFHHFSSDFGEVKPKINPPRYPNNISQIRIPIKKNYESDQNRGVAQVSQSQVLAKKKPLDFF